jgi:hypothetical protein
VTYCAPAGSLADVLPGAAVALGVPGVRVPAVELPPARRVVVLLVDGMGERLLTARGGHAPYLRSLLPGFRVLECGYPSTTATSMGTFGTGLMPGTHGLVGYQVLDPDAGVLFNELSWEPHTDPHRWQPERTVFQCAAADGVDVVQIGPDFFSGSGLTEATLRGARFVAAQHLDRRVDEAVTAVRASRRSLVYVYWGDLDKVGHVHGCASWEWGEELSRVDLAVRTLAARLPDDALLLVTADHGMVDVPEQARIDVACDAELVAGVRLTGGEPRAPMLYCEPGAAPDVLAVWRERFAGALDVLSGDEAVAAGWFGPVVPRVRARIGDVVTAATGVLSVHDSRHQRPELLTLTGMHGARTPDETRVPLLVVPPRA